MPRLANEALWLFYDIEILQPQFRKYVLAAFVLKVKVDSPTIESNTHLCVSECVSVWGREVATYKNVSACRSARCLADAIIKTQGEQSVSVGWGSFFKTFFFLLKRLFSIMCAAGFVCFHRPDAWCDLPDTQRWRFGNNFLGLSVYVFSTTLKPNS